MPTKEDLEELFTYTEAGALIRKKDHYCTKAGQVAGFKSKSGYWFVKVRQKRCPLHRLVWVMHHGPISEGYVIDHINRIRDDNRIENLRIATYKTNARNMSLYSNSVSGWKGVTYRAKERMWNARIRFNGREVLLGRYSRKDYAIVARHTAELLCGYTHVRNINDILLEDE